MADLVSQLLNLATKSLDLSAFHTAAVREIAAVGRGSAVLAGATPEGWRAIAAAGADVARAPLDLAAEAYDSEKFRSAENWAATPLPPALTGGQYALLTKLADANHAQVLASSYAQIAAYAQYKFGAEERERRLESLLAMFAAWTQSSDTRTLLEQMAADATRAFGADRASIFIWDRANKLLIGRPALGMPGNELQIPEDAGVVGRVVRTGQPERVLVEETPEAIERSVDAQTGYVTRTLLCVPLIDAEGDVHGAFELLNKRVGEFTADDEAGLTEMARLAAIALDGTAHYEELLRRREALVDAAAGRVRLLGDCPAIAALRSAITRVADTDLAVLVLGENGTGKEVVAQSLHYGSRRREEPLIAVNCAALTETLLESELFGHERGAFTDARETRPGKFELAAKGTLFLDEIGDMSLGGQAKLLRVLEEKVVVRVGGSQSIHTDARIIAATNQNLAQLVRDRKFREDLYYRLNVVSLELPPLRDRGEDVLLLAEQFLTNFCKQMGRKKPKFTADARKRLHTHRWPGNVRELRNLIERLAYLSSSDRIEAEELAFNLSPFDRPETGIEVGLSLAEATDEFQRDYIHRTIKSQRGNVTDAAKQLDVHRSNLYRKMKQLGMEGNE